jgi:hypothetical protein
VEKTMNNPTKSVEQIKDEPSCPACGAGVLYECVACSQSNYPKPTKSTIPNPVETNNKITNIAEQPVGVVSQRLVMVGSTGRFQTKRCISPLYNGKLEMSPDLKVGDYLFKAATKKEWVGLTNDELDILWEKQQFTEFKSYENDRIEYAKLVEAKLKEKNA